MAFGGWLVGFGWIPCFIFVWSGLLCVGQGRVLTGFFKAVFLSETVQENTALVN